MKKEIPVKQELDALLMRCIDGTASDIELQFGWNWIKENKEHKIYYERMRDIWLSASVFQKAGKEQADKTWIKFKNKNSRIFNAAGIKGIYSTLAKIAAVFIVAFLLGGLSFKALQKKNPDLALSGEYVIEAPRGAKSRVTMTDGTRIHLNAGSRIIYQRAYNQNNRDIVLEGEAYFEVAKNKHLPFYVRSSGITVKAIGTAFNVKAYPDEDIIETTLVEGKISIESIGIKGEKENFVIRPNQKISFYKSSAGNDRQLTDGESDANLNNTGSSIERIELDEEINPEIYTSWKDKRWIFEKQKLSDFAIILERLYDIEIIFRDDKLKNYCLTGSFDEENLEQVLRAIQLTIPLDYAIEHKNVTLSLNMELKNNYENLLKSSTTP